tara:strand:- start:380 stop:2026 length:1647 start_codon:yes stop_codon:yes gene_type:complete
MPTLQELFVQKESELYDYVKYPYGDEDDTQPYRYTTLDNAEPMNPFFEDQSNPISLSARRDFNRMFQFSKSAKGVVFLGKQQFLQTGNTFTQTRLYNPLNLQIHSVPFVHKSRHLNIKQTIESILGGGEDYLKYARLQKETSDDLKSKFDSKSLSPYRKGGILNDELDRISLRNFRRGFLGGFGDLKNSLKPALIKIGKSKIDSVVANFQRQLSPFTSQFTNPTGDRPEIRISYYDEMREFHGIENSYTADDHVTGISYEEQVQQYLAKTRGGGKNISIASPGMPEDGKFVAREWNSRYYKDNIQQKFSIQRKDIDRNFDVDTIDVIFSTTAIQIPDYENVGLVYSDPKAVRFRAFIEDINESVTPTYNENKYIGRYETFYTYNKVVRDLSFKLTLQSFSKVELQHIIQKMSYLTSQAYPTSTGNYITPNILNVKIGNLYPKQPCLLQSLTHNIENDASWDIDYQLPTRIVANVNLRLLDNNTHSPDDNDIYTPLSDDQGLANIFVENAERPEVPEVPNLTLDVDLESLNENINIDPILTEPSPFPRP